MSGPDPDDLPTADDIVSDATARPQPSDGVVSPRDTDADPDDTPEDADIGDGARLISEDVSCANCAKREVCTILNGIQPMLESWDPGQPPIEVAALAVICREYLPEDEVSD